MSIPFLSPIYPADAPCPDERLSFLRGATAFFDFGQQSYKIEYVQGDTSLNLSAIDTKPSWWGIALRIAALATVIIPIIALALIALYRLANTFQTLNRFSALPEDIQKLICQKAVFESPNLFATSEKIHAFMEKDPACIRNRLVSYAIEEALKTAHAMGSNPQGASALSDIAEFVLPLDKERGLKIIESALERAKAITIEAMKNQEFSKIVQILACYDLKRAEEIVESLPAEYKGRSLLTLAMFIANEDCEKALEMVNSLGDLSYKQRALSKIAISMAKVDDVEALKIADSLEDIHKFTALKGIAPIVFAKNQELGRHIANEAAEIASHQNDRWVPDRELLGIIWSFFIKHDRERAIALARTMRSKVNFAMILAQVDPDEALRFANTIGDRADRCFALCHIASSIKTTQPERALELVEQALIITESITWAGSIEKKMSLSSCARAMALFNLEKAIEIAKSIDDNLLGDRSETLTQILRVIPPGQIEEVKLAAGLIFKEARSFKVCEIPVDDNTIICTYRFKTVFGVAKALS